MVLQDKKFDHQATITHYSKKGVGITADGLEVPGSVVGDCVQIEKHRRRKRVSSYSVLEPSSDRTPHPCPYIGQCGGCSWGEKAYLAQIKTKERLIKTLFPKEPAPIIPAPDIWRYRGKMEYTFSQDREGNKFLGLMMRQGRGKVVNLEECHLTPSWFVSVLNAVRTWWRNSNVQAYFPRLDQGTLRNLTLRAGSENLHNKMVILTISGRQEWMLNRTDLDRFTKAIIASVPGDDPAIFLRIQKIKKGTPTRFYEMHLFGPQTIEQSLQIHGKTFSFSISPDSFFQPNPQQAATLYEKALHIAQPKSHEVVWDLYGGTGTLGMIFAPFAKQVEMVELSHYAVCDAHTNQKKNQIANLTIHQGDVAQVAQTLPQPDLIVLDPPRCGLLKQGISVIGKANSKKILYISCNPYTQQEDIQTLCTEYGYELTTLQPIDQFPHTYHLENIALLIKKSAT